MEMMETVKMEEVKVEEVCRLCLGDRPCVYLFDSGLGLMSKVASLCRISPPAPADGFPEYVCALCADALETAVAFRERCENSDRILRRQTVAPTAPTYNPYIPNISYNTNIPIVTNIPNNTKTFKNTNVPKNKKIPKNAEISKNTKVPKNTKISKNQKTPKNTTITKPPKIPRARNYKECPFCGTRFVLRAPFEEHLRSHRPLPFECDHCGKRFESRAKLSYHMKNHTTSLQCEVCGLVFNCFDVAYQHLKFVHRRAKPLQCDHCDAVFYRRKQYEHHVNSHLGIETVKRIKCELCERTFTSKHGLRGHMLTHTGEMPHECLSCGSKFKSKKTLVDHMMLHTGETPHHCPVCDKGFVQLSNMKSHFRNNHKGIPFQYKNKRNRLSTHTAYKVDAN